MSVLNVLHCVSSLNIGGAEKCAVNLAQHQASVGYKAAVMSFGSEDEPFCKELRNANIDVFIVNGNILQRALKLFRIIKDFDYIHIHSPAVIRAFTFVFPALYSKWVIYTMHGEHQATLFGMKSAHYLANGYLNQKFAVSNRVKAGVEQRYGWQSEDVTVIANGIPVSRQKKEQHSKHEKMQFGMVARLVELKQIDQVVLQMRAENLQTKAHLNIYGEGPLETQLQALVDQYQLSEHVTLHGREMDPDKIYNSIDCLIINSTTEGLPMVMLEAMSYGVPLVSTKVGAIPELIDKGRFGLLIDIGDTHGLATAMESVIDDPEHYAQMSNRAFDFVEEHYALSKVSEQYLAAYLKGNAHE